LNITQGNVENVVDGITNRIVQLPPDEQTDENFVRLTDTFSRLDSLIQDGSLVATDKVRE